MKITSITSSKQYNFTFIFANSKENSEDIDFKFALKRITEATWQLSLMPALSANRPLNIPTIAQLIAIINELKRLIAEEEIEEIKEIKVEVQSNISVNIDMEETSILQMYEKFSKKIRIY